MSTTVPPQSASFAVCARLELGQAPEELADRALAPRAAGPTAGRGAAAQTEHVRHYVTSTLA